MIYSILFLSIYSLLGVSFSEAASDVCISEKEKELFNVVNEYRVKKNLPVVPFSASLTKVSQAHVKDLVENYKFDPNAKCNPHSWSKKGEWTGCCYKNTSDPKNAKCMWDKPREIANYDSEGFEILYYSSNGVDPEEALEGWKDSPGHHNVIINAKTWEKVEWKSMGVGILGEYAVVWFGRIDDSSAELVLCK